MDQAGDRHDLQQLLGLTVPPITISFQKTPPPNVSRISQELPASCGYWRHAAEGNVFYTEASDHYTCPVGAHTHGVELPPEVATNLNETVGMMVDLQYIKMEEIPLIPRRQEPFKIAVYAPLGRNPFPADVVLIRGSVKQLMILAEAAQSAGIAGGGATMGRPTCAILPESINSQKSSTSFGCIGNRVYTGLEEGEGYYAIPGKDLQLVADKVSILIQANHVLEKFHQARRSVAS